ncbi:MAG TPA: S8 family serine peptidase [Candidatus Angelobacter sp.]|nr:S8 family serine peptidase [Candidatus Angelobacter sp.]
MISRVSMEAQTRLIVRDTLGEQALKLVCALLHCAVNEGLDGTLGTLFLVTAQDGISVQGLLTGLLNQVGIEDVEPDLNLKVKQMSAPSGLYDTSPVSYYGTTVWNGYATQPAAQIIGLAAAQSTYNVTGTGIVAVIDTGVDPTHPVLQGILLQGRDFTRNQNVGSELTDVNQSTMAVVNGASPAQVNQSTMAVVNSTGSSTFSQPQFAAFGHGTMVAGIVHLVAPTAQIMPLKSFHADGSGYLTDVLKAIYYSRQHGANIVSMSFDFSSYSNELAHAINYVVNNGLICVASVGNDGQAIVVYPAGLGNVVGVASTANDNTLSTFSNFGQPPVWLGAPGEGIITTYPYGTYAAGWGTSFSTPFVSGAMALLRSMDTSLNQTSAAQAVSNAVYISPALGYGRLDVGQAVAAWCVTTHHC